MADGRECLLIPGKYSALQVAIIEKFGPRFVPGATVLHISDTPEITAIHEKDALEQLGIMAATPDELPDIVLHYALKDRLYFIEAGIVHQAITYRRKRELEQISKNCNAARVFVSAFPDFSMYGKYAIQIAWESHIWIATNPDHTIYYDGQESFAVHG